jgi:hypothetical protein
MADRPVGRNNGLRSHPPFLVLPARLLQRRLEFGKDVLANIRTCCPKSGTPSTSMPAHAIKVNGSVNETKEGARPEGA